MNFCQKAGGKCSYNVLLRQSSRSCCYEFWRGGVIAQLLSILQLLNVTASQHNTITSFFHSVSSFRINSSCNTKHKRLINYIRDHIYCSSFVFVLNSWFLEEQICTDKKHLKQIHFGGLSSWITTMLITSVS